MIKRTLQDKLTQYIGKRKAILLLSGKLLITQSEMLSGYIIF